MTDHEGVSERDQLADEPVYREVVVPLRDDEAGVHLVEDMARDSGSLELLDADSGPTGVGPVRLLPHGAELRTD